MLAAAADEFAGDLLRVAQIDLGASRPRRTEGKPGELQLGRRLRRAFADQVHGGVAHGLIGLLGKHLKPIGDGRDGIDHIVTDAARNERRKVEIAECRRLGHGPLLRFRVTPRR